MIRSGILFLTLFLVYNSLAATVSEKVYILADSLEAVDNVKFPYITFNPSNNFTQVNPVIELAEGDSLDLWVVNFDSVSHDFMIADFTATFVSIPAGDSALVGYTFNQAGAYIYHDPLDAPKYQYLGLSGMIVVKDHNHASFYWNIKEHDDNWNNSLVNNGAVNWSAYSPNYFTINGNSNPDINNDPTARIIGNVGDTLMVYMVNTGQSIHSLHFHGYHAVILFSSKSVLDVGREKDTFPIFPMEVMVLRLVPDKEGEYPVHDHNLVAVTANNFYPNGMFTTMLISP